MDVFQGKIAWPEQSIKRVETCDGYNVLLHLPILKHRWPMFAENRQEAMNIARSLTLEELNAVLLFLYSEFPVKHTMLPILNRCGLTLPRSLTERSFMIDMKKLVADHESADFMLVAGDRATVPVHQVVLAARTKFFRSMFLVQAKEVADGSWTCTRALHVETLRFFVEYLYTGRIEHPQAMYLIPVMWLVKYLGMATGPEKVDNVVFNALDTELTEETRPMWLNIGKEWDVKSVVDFVERVAGRTVAKV